MDSSITWTFHCTAEKTVQSCSKDEKEDLRIRNWILDSKQHFLHLPSVDQDVYIFRHQTIAAVRKVVSDVVEVAPTIDEPVN